jgi:hypothetical protein
MYCERPLRRYEQPNAGRRDAGDRTQALRRRTLYQTTASQAKTAMKRPLGYGSEYANNANGDLRLDVSLNNFACMRYSYSHATQLDVAVGKVLAQACKATPTALRAAHERAGRKAPPRAAFETTQSITNYGANVIVTDACYNRGLYNRMVYDPNNRLKSGNAGFPGVIVDPSGAIFTIPQHKNPYIDVCSNMFGTDMCLNTVVATAIPPLLRQTAEAVVMDACFGFPLRTKFVP